MIYMIEEQKETTRQETDTIGINNSTFTQQILYILDYAQVKTFFIRNHAVILIHKIDESISVEFLMQQAS